MSRSQDIDQLDTKNNETRQKIAFIQQVKQFAEEKLYLSKTYNYTRYIDLCGKPLSYVIYACKKDSFDLLTWNFPIIGKLNYKGFFSKDDALNEKKKLEELGYDTAIYHVSAYSTLGYFRDPILSSMLELSKHELANLVIHENVHATIYSKTSSDFNESLASFIADKGTLEFLKAMYPEELETAIKEEHKRNKRGKIIAELFNVLNALYKSKIAKETKLIRKKEIINQYKTELGGKEINNASIMASLTYHEPDIYDPLLKTHGWQKFIEICKAAKDMENPKEYLKSLAENR